MGTKSVELAPEQLRKVCDPEELGFNSTAEVPPLEGTIGQERATEAMEFGLGIDAPGFNIFVAGPPGSGRNATLAAYLDKAASGRPRPNDWCYVHNFHEPSSPVAISLPCGSSQEFSRDINDLIEGCRREIPKAFDSDSYRQRLEGVMQEIQAQREALKAQLEEEALKQGFAVNFTPSGIVTIPIKDGRPIPNEEYSALTEEERNQLREKGDQLQQFINTRLVEFPRLEKLAAERTRAVNSDVAHFTIDPMILELGTKYQDHPKIVHYLEDLKEDMVEHSEIFRGQQPGQQEPAQRHGLPIPPVEDDPFTRYRVNALVNNISCPTAPTVFEHNPTYYNLFGRVEYRARFGAMTTDLTMIKPGAIHRANGGYLVIQARELLMNPLSWEALKQSISTREARIQNIGEQYSPIPTATLNPEPIPLDTKVILVGSPYLYRLLQVSDEDFRKHFKVLADFDTSMERTPDKLRRYASFISLQCKELGLKPFDKSAVAEVVDYSTRLVEHQEKLTTRFSDISDILTEADFWAGKDGDSELVMGKHIRKAIEQRIRRANLSEEKIQELIEDGTIHIDTRNQVVGQVNGLAILSLGDYSFGKPSRITANVSLGRGQMINIERETQTSGRIHNKGFMILTGYVSEKYGHDKPLSLNASIGFEQTYDEVDGDSASSTELYALLSSLSRLPIKQGIAVTGSVNQKGEIQAIGGATRKIEGYYDVCKAHGLTGEQGVMIPRDNVKNLMLQEEVVQAVSQGKFHIYAVSTVDEGIEVLTGVPAGTPNKDRTYKKGSVNYLVEKRLLEMAKKAREYSRSLDGDQRQDGEEKRSKGSS